MRADRRATHQRTSGLSNFPPERPARRRLRGGAIEESPSIASGPRCARVPRVDRHVSVRRGNNASPPARVGASLRIRAKRSREAQPDGSARLAVFIKRTAAGAARIKAFAMVRTIEVRRSRTIGVAPGPQRRRQKNTRAAPEDGRGSTGITPCDLTSKGRRPERQTTNSRGKYVAHGDPMMPSVDNEEARGLAPTQRLARLQRSSAAQARRKREIFVA